MTMASLRSRCCPVAGIGLLALVALGCGGQGNVSGKVTFQNKAVPFGTVLIEGSDGSHSQGNIASDGSYSVLSIAPGKVKVAVNSPNPKSSALTPINKNRKMATHP